MDARFEIRPKATVLMPVYNASKYLRSSIESVLAQTYRDFEFLIIDDASTDDSAAIVLGYTDTRIRYSRMDRNQGIAKVLNVGIDMCYGEYIIRMDSDDIALPDRIETQVAFMDEHPEVGVSGSWVEYFNDRSGIVKALADHENIVWSLMFGCTLFHPSVIIRYEVLKRTGVRYPTEYPHAEDYGLWVQLAGVTRFANIQRVTLRYRVSGLSVSGMNKALQTEMGSLLMRAMHDKLLSRPLSESEWETVNEESVEPIETDKIWALYSTINTMNRLFSSEVFREKVQLRIKQLIIKRGASGASVKWLLVNSMRNWRLLRYVLYYRP